jgi:energy-coupling factor transport system substrate-specific component
VSWQLGAFAVLGAGLLAGFAWYERTRPDARIVALVGTLAAFGALGRIAFAAIPNVKPTTDIVLIAGFALGGAPGYVVGAVAALSSNFFFGQGPWTPWQMAGWGLVGIGGALLARGTRGRIGRASLAAISFVVGFAFTALQDVGDWVTYSDHSLAQLGVYVGKGLGFDLIHACGCFAFALAFGPSMIRALRRFRKRLHVTWLPSAAELGSSTLALIAVGALAASAVRPTPASAASAVRPTPASAASRAASGHRTPIEYLLSVQNRDGGFGLAPGQASSTMASGWVAMAFEYGGVDPRHAAVRGGPNLIDYLAGTINQETDPGSIERTALAASKVGDVLKSRFGRLRKQLSRLAGRNGSVRGQTNLTAFGILAMRAALLEVPKRMVSWLARQQDRDGGFNYATAGAVSDVDDTGAALEALAGSGHAAVVRGAVAFLRAAQNRDGGFPSAPGGASNAQSTAFAIQGLIAAGVSPGSVRRGQSPSPIAYLRSLIQRDGAVDYAKGVTQTPVWVTAQTQLALSGRAL